MNYVSLFSFLKHTATGQEPISCEDSSVCAPKCTSGKCINGVCQCPSMDGNTKIVCDIKKTIEEAAPAVKSLGV